LLGTGRGDSRGYNLLKDGISGDLPVPRTQPQKLEIWRYLINTFGQFEVLIATLVEEMYMYILL
jgi:hypothetical protein